MKFALLFCLLVIIGLSIASRRAFAQTRARSPAAAALDKALSSAVEHKDVPGVVVIAADKKGVIYQGAFGMAETGAGRAMSVDAIFRIASMTKAVTSTAMMQLVEAGKVSLDDPASKYFPEFANPMVFESFDPVTKDYKVRPAKTVITLRHLLTHTSGLGYPFTSAIVRDFKPREGDKFGIGPLLFEPGTDWCYGTGVDWSGKVVEQVSGQTLEAYFQEKIFGPLKLVDTTFSEPASKYARIVNVYDHVADGSFTEQPRANFQPVTRFNGGGGLFSTVGDYVRFLRMVLNGGELDGAKILSHESIAVMGRNQIGAVGVRALKTAQPERSADLTYIADGRDKWGIGFQITADAVPGKRSAGSLSWGGIDNTYFWVDPTRGVAGVIMMQFLPFADPKALGVYDTFERGVYQLIAK